MESYIDETQAKEFFQTLIEEHTNDYKLFIRKRELERDLTAKMVQFAIIVKEKDAEDIFNSLVVKKVDGESALVGISSGFLFDERDRVIKDMIMVDVRINYE